MFLAVNRWTDAFPSDPPSWKREIPEYWCLLDGDQMLFAISGVEMARKEFSHSEFCKVLATNSLVVGWNLKPLLFRLSVDHELTKDAKVKLHYATNPNTGRKGLRVPYIEITPIDGGAAFYFVRFPIKSNKKVRAAQILDLRQIGLKKPANLDDMLKVARDAVIKHYQHPVDLPITSIVSSGTIIDGYMRALGVRPLLEKFPMPAEFHQAGMCAYHGGWTSTFHHGKFYGVYTDEAGCYPKHMINLGVSNVLAAESATWDEPTLETALEELPEHPWVLLEINVQGHVVPVKYKKKANDPWSLSIDRPVHMEGTYWITAYDYLLGIHRFDSKPTVTRVLRVKFHGRQEGLNELQYGQRKITVENFFHVLMELKKEDKATWKTPVNSVYGKFGQMAGGKPGILTFPIIAACITGAARLTLGLTMAQFERRGGKVIMCDTDSMFVHDVGKKEFDEVQKALSPLTDWEWEKVNEPTPLYVNAVDTKRYQLYGDEGIRDKSDLVIGSYDLSKDQLMEASAYLSDIGDAPAWINEPAELKWVVSLHHYEQLDRRYPMFEEVTLRVSREFGDLASLYYIGYQGEWRNMRTGELAHSKIDWQTYKEVFRLYLMPKERETGPINIRYRRNIGGFSVSQHEQVLGLHKVSEDEVNVWQEQIMPLLREVPAQEICSLTGLHRNTIMKMKNGSEPHISTKQQVICALGTILFECAYHDNASDRYVKAIMDKLALCGMHALKSRKE